MLIVSVSCMHQIYIDFVNTCTYATFACTHTFIYTKKCLRIFYFSSPEDHEKFSSTNGPTKFDCLQSHGWKTSVLESLFNRVAGQRPATLSKTNSGTGDCL